MTNLGRRRAGAVLAALLLVVAALGGRGAPADGPQGPVENRTSRQKVLARDVNPAEVRGSIELVTWRSSPLEGELVAEALRRFRTAYPKIRVRYTPVSGDYTSAVLTRFAGGNAPDVVVVDGRAAPDWIAKGMLMPIDGYVSSNDFALDAFHPQLLDGFRDGQGHLYGLPKDYSTLALYVNDRMLRRAGVQPPRTWKELQSVARTLRQRASVPGMCIAPSWDRLSVFALQNGGGIVSPEGRMTVDAAPTRQAARYYLSLLEGGAGATPAQVGASWCGDALGKQQVAMAIEGAWLIPVLETSFPDVEWSIHELPVGKRAANLAFSPAYAISSTSRNPDAAWVLVQHLTGRSGMKQWTDQGLALPSRSDVPPPSGRAALGAGLAHAVVFQLPPGFSNRVYLTAENELTATIEGERTVEEMLRRIDRVGEAMLRRQQQDGGTGSGA